MKKILWGIFSVLFLISSECISAPPMVVFYKFSESCPKNKPFIGDNEKGNCIGCDFSLSIDIEQGHEKDFEICKNRETINGISYIKCPADKPMRKYACEDCNSEMIEFSEEECNKCPNRKYTKITEYGHAMWVCLRKKINSNEVDIPSIGWDFITDGYGLAYPDRLAPEYTSCPPHKPMVKINKKSCESCNSYLTDFSEDECKKCSNRKYSMINHKILGNLGMGCLRKFPNSDRLEIPSAISTGGKSIYEYWGTASPIKGYEYFDFLTQKVIE